MHEFSPKTQFTLFLVSAISAFTSYYETKKLTSDFKELVDCVYAYETVKEMELLGNIGSEG